MRSFFLLALVLSWLHSPFLPVRAEEKDAHEHHGTAAVGLTLDDGKKWKTDEALREGMTKIKDALSPSLKLIHENKLGKQQYTELSDEIGVAVQSIFKNCKLEPKADAVLHVVLAKILKGSSEMKAGSTVKLRRTGAVEVLGALEQYAKYFDHPSWNGFRH